MIVPLVGVWSVHHKGVVVDCDGHSGSQVDVEPGLGDVARFLVLLVVRNQRLLKFCKSRFYQEFMK